MGRRRAQVSRTQQRTLPTSASGIARRFSTEAWEVWTGAREATLVETVRLGSTGSRTPRTAALRPQKGIPRALRVLRAAIG